ncbi:MAG: carbon-nitrogen hydrolase family protein [Deltaproteobacteria bacterium]|nr:carbon-nitrogen hydrolase family protein [Deltaproteobacteria bacterium]
MAEPHLAAVVQLTSTADVPRNLRRAAELAERAASRGAMLVVLPENVAFLGPEEEKLQVCEAFEPGAPPQGPIGRALRDVAKRTRVWALWGGLPERTTDPTRTYNTSVLVDPAGSLVARYRKIHLFDVALADGTTLTESRTVLPGDAVVTAETPVGRLGLSICYDLRFPELYRRLVDQGATVLTVPAAFTVPTGKDHWHVLLRARAIESQCHLLAAAQWGSHGNGRTTYGHALIVDPWGTVLAECGDGEGIALAELDQSRTERVRATLPSLRHRRL